MGMEIAIRIGIWVERERERDRERERERAKGAGGGAGEGETLAREANSRTGQYITETRMRQDDEKGREREGGE